MLLPKKFPNITAITLSINNGDNALHAIPNTVRLYLFLKSLFISSSKRNWYIFSFVITISHRKIRYKNQSLSNKSLVYTFPFTSSKNSSYLLAIITWLSSLNFSKLFTTLFPKNVFPSCKVGS